MKITRKCEKKKEENKCVIEVASIDEKSDEEEASTCDDEVSSDSNEEASVSEPPLQGVYLLNLIAVMMALLKDVLVVGRFLSKMMGRVLREMIGSSLQGKCPLVMQKMDRI